MNDDNFRNQTQFNNSVGYYEVRVQQTLVKTYAFVLIALVISAISAFMTLSSEEFFMALMNKYMILVIAEVAIVFIASFAIRKNKIGLSALLFIVYSIINGMTMSFLLLAFQGTSVASIFVITAVTFGVMAIYGLVTKTDLTAIGNIGLMALIGIVIASLFNMFIKSEGFNLVIAILGVAIFVGLTAYDSQKIKRLAMNDSLNTNSIALMGAFTLYLDFVNMFIYLLRLFGRRR